MNILLKTVGLLFFPCLVFADTQCIAVKVSDGDTFTCKGTYQRLIQVRLADKGRIIKPEQWRRKVTK